MVEVRNLGQCRVAFCKSKEHGWGKTDQPSITGWLVKRKVNFDQFNKRTISRLEKNVLIIIGKELYLYKRANFPYDCY